ncbi:MAG: TraR/DksA family transcriptional regulator, partial [Actinomycetota bacterium]
MEKGLDAVRRQLEAELVDVEKELADLGAAPDGSVVLSFDEGFADAAQTTSERAKTLSLIDGMRHRVDDVRAAIQRVERGIYGRCERCGKEISPERLEAVPTAR